MLRKHLRSFENQINNIIRRTKGKRTMLKFHQIYSAKKIPEGMGISLENHSSPTENSKKPIFLNGKPFKKKQKIEGKNFSNFFQKFSEIFPKHFRKIFLKVTGNFFEVA